MRDRVYGAGVRWADVQLPEGDLPLTTFARLISDRTRLVAVSAASNLIGTRPDVAGIAGLAHAAGALDIGVDHQPYVVELERRVGEEAPQVA